MSATATIRRVVATTALSAYWASDELECGHAIVRYVSHVQIPPMRRLCDMCGASNAGVAAEQRRE